MSVEPSIASPRTTPSAPPPPRARRASWWEAPALLGIGAAVVAAVSDAEVARDLIVLGGISGALGVILHRLSPRPLESSDVPSTPRDEADAEDREHFLALAAHELRTPLTGVLGLSDLLGETALTAEQTAYVGALRGSASSLLRLVDGYLDLSRLESGHVQPKPIATALETVVEDVVELLAPSCQAKGLEIAGHVAPALAGTVFVDPLLLRQVLINLLGNAVKFTEVGGVAVDVSVVPGGGDAVLFQVRDTGIGIAPEAASRIFEAWERIEAEGGGRAAGNGLGLAIARGIVERMGGHIELSSRSGEGSTFSFVLELPRATAAPTQDRPLKGRRVAVISTAVVEPPLLVRRLHGSGAEAWLAASAADLDATAAYDVVLVDGRGDEALASLSALRGAGIEAPAIVMVTPSARADLPRLRAAGFAAHLIRPVRPASLARVVALAVGRDRPSAEVSVTPADAARTDGADVLLVDDNEINVLLGRAALEHAGHRVDVETDGAAALAAVDAARRAGRPYAAVLMDLHMPGLDGFEAIRALRAGEAARDPRTVVVALTADTTPEAADRAAAAGADATMVKPIDRDRLARLLASKALSAA